MNKWPVLETAWKKKKKKSKIEKTGRRLNLCSNLSGKKAFLQVGGHCGPEPGLFLLVPRELSWWSANSCGV